MRIKKFNNSAGAILCSKCRVIVKEGFSEEGVDPKKITEAEWKSNKPLYCERCKEKLKNKKTKK